MRSLQLEAKLPSKCASSFPANWMRVLHPDKASRNSLRHEKVIHHCKP